MNYLFLYLFNGILVELLLMLLSFFIFKKININFGSELEIIILRALTITYMFFLASDILCQLTYVGYLNISFGLLNALAILNMFLPALVACYWFFFAELHLGIKTFMKKNYQWLMFLPLFIVMFLYAFSINTHWLFQLNHGRILPGPYYYWALILEEPYLLIPCVQSIRLLRQDRTNNDAIKYRIIIGFMVIPTFCGLVELAIPHTILMPTGIFAAIIVAFISMQDANIYFDALTHLNNRRRSDEYLEECIHNCSKAHPLVFYMLDIDYFKKINDQYGHNEGDRALQIVAKGLRQVGKDYHIFTARWGGDEFVVFGDARTIKDPLYFKEYLRECINREVFKEKLPYQIQISIGSTYCDDPYTNPEVIVQESDESLYIEKNKTHSMAMDYNSYKDDIQY